MKIKSICKRLKKDLIPKSFKKTYFEFLFDLKTNNFTIASLEECNDIILSKSKFAKLAGLRHDVDIHNISGNRMFFQIEKDLGITAIYYFRKKTAHSHRKFINELLENGFKVGYHYEEGSDIAKLHKISSRDDLFSHVEEIKSLFAKNTGEFRRQFNPDLSSVCAHGDWIDRKLNFINYEFIDQDLLKQCGLAFEAYKSEIFEESQYYLTDTQTDPERWNYEELLQLDVLYILTHERSWHSDPISNIRENLVRISESISYNLRF